MAIYKPSFFQIIGSITPPPNYPSMVEDISEIDSKVHHANWHLAKCIIVPKGDPSYVFEQKYEIYVGYDATNKALYVAAPCPPFCSGSAGEEE